MTKHTIEVYVAMNEDGDYVVGTDEADTSQALTDEVGGYACRVVKLNVTMSAPTTEELSITLPDETGETTKIEA